MNFKEFSLKMLLLNIPITVVRTNAEFGSRYKWLIESHKFTIYAYEDSRHPHVYLDNQIAQYLDTDRTSQIPFKDTLNLIIKYLDLINPPQEKTTHDN